MAAVAVPPCLLDGADVGSAIDGDVHASVFVPKQG
ncbi:hypothetical protein A2U01_0069051, partial [Trifolium medium]|nr:hypothetical protein [Trifolium medium]